MKDDTDSWEWISRLLHFSDSALPVGAYAHSFGLEGVCQIGVVHDKETLKTFLARDITDALLHIDLPLTARAHAAAMNGHDEELIKLDQLSWALRPTRQLRAAASRIGKQQASIYEKTWAKNTSIILPHQQSPIVLGALFAYESTPVNAALWSMAYQTFLALLQAALKLLPIGPAATQELLHHALKNMEPKISSAINLPIDDIGSFNPVWDIGASQHEHTAARLFIS